MIKIKNDLPYYIKKAEQNDKYGDGIIAFPDDYVVLDLETTGLCAGRDLIIEFAAVKVKGGQVVDTFQSLCDPGFPIPPAIEAITGITTEMVRNSPNPRSVLPDFLDFVGDSYIVGHNVLFDVRFITASAGTFKNTYIDTMKVFRKLHPAFPHHRLCDMVEYYGKRNDSAHRALSDCLATKECFDALKEDASRLYGDTFKFLTSIK